jgi:hypothetical protein
MTQIKCDLWQRQRDALAGVFFKKTFGLIDVLRRKQCSGGVTCCDIAAGTIRILVANTQKRGTLV